MKWGLNGGISIDADSGPPKYVLWCCGGIFHQPDTYIQIGSGHTVMVRRKFTKYVVIWKEETDISRSNLFLLPDFLDQSKKTQPKLKS